MSDHPPLPGAAEVVKNLVEDHQVTPSQAAQFDALMDSLEIPDQAPRLTEAAGRPCRFTRA